MPKSTTKANPADFEKKMDQLNQLVEQMETGNLSLADALKQFEKGVLLADECQHILSHAKQKVSQLIEKHDGPTLEPFSVDDSQ